MNTQETELIAIAWVFLIMMVGSGICWQSITRHVKGHMRVMAVVSSGVCLLVSILLFTYLMSL